MKPTAFIQRAKGEFTVMLAPGTPHCGPDQSDKPIPGHFSYEVEIDYDSDALDDRGFLLDNKTFQNYFNSLNANGPIEISCEKLCEQAEAALCEMVSPRRKDCQKIEVKIFPMPGVSVEYDCYPNQRVPSFNQILSRIGDFAVPFAIGAILASLPIGFMLWMVTQ